MDKQNYNHTTNVSVQNPNQQSQYQHSYQLNFDNQQPCNNQSYNKQQINYPTQHNNLQPNYYRQPQYHHPKRVCPVCGGVDFVYCDYPIDDTPCWITVLMILLIFVPVIGWFIDFVLLCTRTDTIYTFATCTHCGRRENVQQNYNEYLKNEKKQFKQYQKNAIKQYKAEKKAKRQLKKQLRKQKKMQK